MTNMDRCRRSRLLPAIDLSQLVAHAPYNISGASTKPVRTKRPMSRSKSSFFEKLEPGVFWLDAQKRDEGLNLIDFAAKQYGPGFTIETGMQCPFEERVRQHLLVVQTAVDLFEQRHA
jgi:hypothetical protein